jgi:hypothetical protein
VIVVVRAAPSFAAAATVAAPLLLPVDGVTVAQVSELAAVQLTLDSTAIVATPPEEAIVVDDGKTTSIGASCVRLTVCVTPPPVKITVAVRAAPVLFAAAVTAAVPLPLPEDGETVAQEAELPTVQLMSDVTVTVSAPPEAVKLNAACETVRDGEGVPAAACVTVTACKGTPPPLNIIVAVRAAPLFAAAVTVTAPLLLPDDGETVAQASVLLTFQPVLDVTVTVVVPPEEAMFAVAGKTAREFTDAEI